MLKYYFLLFVLLISGISFSQSNRWSSISYSYSKGPVSPEYQYNFVININENRTGKLIYTKNNKTSEYDFTFGKKRMKKLKKSLKKSKVFSVSPDQMKSENNLMGGPEKNLLITKWQSPDLDARPETISIPSQVNEIYSAGIDNLYKEIENLVPPDIWAKAKGD
ncbi:MAG: hypothetical protein JNJ56_00665 [Ignavibacteria bacterium]|nr:hypothetical protein [Ignavibacteria bacterium]